MSESPDEIRAEIERTRSGLGADVDALADKVTPSKIAHRQTNKMKRAMNSMSERVMGSAESGQSTVSDAADQTSEMMHQAKAKAEGNPVAVGLIAFGAGLLAASLIPASEKEKSLAETAKQEAQPLMDQASESAKEVASHLKEPAQATKDRASEAVDHVKEQGSNATSQVKGRTEEARGNLSEN